MSADCCAADQTEESEQSSKNVVEPITLESVTPPKNDSTESTDQQLPLTVKLSKNQQKRLARHQQWIATKAERKKREKDKIKAKKAQKILAGEVVISRNQLKAQLVKMADSPCKVSVVIDCDYSQYMNEFELKKLCKQLNRCYAINKHSSRPVQLYITSINGAVKELLDKYQQGYHNWDAHCTEKHWKQIFCDNDTTLSSSSTDQSQDSSSDSKLNSNIVYLSGDSSDLIPECGEIQQSNHHIFIIGGLIDHNRYKGLALERAQQAGVQHGQLPIGEHIKMAQRKILAIPHVFEIMLHASNGSVQGQCWNQIFKRVIPLRKLDCGQSKSNIVEDGEETKS